MNIEKVNEVTWEIYITRLMIEVNNLNYFLILFSFIRILKIMEYQLHMIKLKNHFVFL